MTEQQLERAKRLKEKIAEVNAIIKEFNQDKPRLNITINQGKGIFFRSNIYATDSEGLSTYLNCSVSQRL